MYQPQRFICTGHITSYLIYNVLPVILVLQSFFLIVDIIWSKFCPIFHIYSSSVNDWCTSAFVIIDPSQESSSIDDSSIEAEIDSYYSVKFILFPNKPPSSNCEKVMISQFCSWDDVAYGIYKTSGCIASDSNYRSYVYANALENVSSNTYSREENILCVLGT